MREINFAAPAYTSAPAPFELWLLYCLFWQYHLAGTSSTGTCCKSSRPLNDHYYYYYLYVGPIACRFGETPRPITGRQHHINRNYDGWYSKKGKIRAIHKASSTSQQIHKRTFRKATPDQRSTDLLTPALPRSMRILTSEQARALSAAGRCDDNRTTATDQSQAASSEKFLP